VTSVFEILENRFRFGMSLPDAVAFPRFHHQWKPDILKAEKFGLSPETESALKILGYQLDTVTAIAKTHSLERFPNGRIWGAADPRGEGAAVAE
jgi:gamma-glutamyltranspeptidase/glutathione hydrolase